MGPVTLEHLKIWRAIIQRPLSSSPRSGLVPMEVPTLEVKLPQLLQQHQVQTQQQHKVVMTQQLLLGTVIVQVVIWIPVFLFVLLNHQTFSNSACKTAPKIVLQKDQNTSNNF